MLFRLNGILILAEYITHDFRAFHRDRERVAFAEMVGTRIIRAIGLHHGNRAEVEIGVSVRAAIFKLLDDLCRLPDRIPMDALLVGGDQIGVHADLRQNIDEQ